MVNMALSLKKIICLPNIDKAVEQAKIFASDEEDLVDNIGCNLWKLMEELKSYKR